MVVQPPIIAASRKIAANIVFGPLSTRATIGSDLPSPARSARIDHTHPATQAASHASGTSLAIPGGNGTAVSYEKYAAPTADEATTTSSARPPFDMCVLNHPLDATRGVEVRRRVKYTEITTRSIADERTRERVKRHRARKKPGAAERCVTLL